MHEQTLAEQEKSMEGTTQKHILDLTFSHPRNQERIAFFESK